MKLSEFQSELKFVDAAGIYSIKSEAITDSTKSLDMPGFLESMIKSGVTENSEFLYLLHNGSRCFLRRLNDLFLIVALKSLVDVNKVLLEMKSKDLLQSYTTR